MGCLHEGHFIKRLQVLPLFQFSSPSHQGGREQVAAWYLSGLKPWKQKKEHCSLAPAKKQNQKPTKTNKWNRRARELDVKIRTPHSLLPSPIPNEWKLSLKKSVQLTSGRKNGSFWRSRTCSSFSLRPDKSCFFRTFLFSAFMMSCEYLQELQENTQKYQRLSL